MTTRTPSRPSRHTSGAGHFDIHDDDPEPTASPPNQEHEHDRDHEHALDTQAEGTQVQGADNTALLPDPQWETLTPGYFARRVTQRLDGFERASSSADADDERHDGDDDDGEGDDEELEEDDNGLRDEEGDEGFDETDPFEDDHSDDSEEDAVLQEKQAAQSAHGLFHVFRPSHSRDVSRATAIHLNSPHSPSTPRRARHPRSSYDSDTLSASSEHVHETEHVEDADQRKVSNNTAISSMPDELAYYQSSIPGRHLRSPLAEDPGSGNRNNAMGMATPGGAFTPLTPLTKRRQMQSRSPLHSRAGSGLAFGEEGKENAGRGAFRNPSSVRAMQLSCPSPPPLSSSRRREMLRAREEEAERSGTPSRQKHPDPRKEYPLVLLHCTIHPLLSYSSGFLKEVVGEEDGIARDTKLLEEKLSEKVLERGVLISHPGDDYEVLEERVLESLELRRPRVGGCGHFHEGVAVGENTDKVANCDCEKTGLDEDLGRKKCVDCGKHVSHALLQEHDGQETAERTRRWDIRVYASNGLMRAGAWSAAWREMEKVDVEVGVWMSDSVKRSLDEKMLQLRQEEQRNQERTPERPGIRRPMHGRSKTAGAVEPFASVPAPVTPASKAACSRAPSLDLAKMMRGRDDAPLQEPCQARTERPAEQKSEEVQELPLTTLINKYLERQLQSKRDFILPVMILLLGIALAGRNLFGPSTIDIESSLKAAPGPIQDGQPLVDTARMMSSINKTTTQELGVFSILPICAFKLEEAEGKEMVAMEWTKAQECLLPKINAQQDPQTKTSYEPDAGSSDTKPEEIASSKEEVSKAEETSNVDDSIADSDEQIGVGSILQQVLEVAAPQNDEAELD